MAISHVGVTTGATSASYPAGTVDGDVVIVATLSSPTVPSGWTVIATNRLYAKVVNGDTSTGTWVNAEQLICSVYRGVDATRITGAVSLTSSTSSTLNYSALTFTKQDGLSWALLLGRVTNVSATLGTPSGAVNRGGVVTGAAARMALHDSNGGIVTWAGASVAMGVSAAYTANRIELIADESTWDLTAHLIDTAASLDIAADEQAPTAPAVIDSFDGRTETDGLGTASDGSVWSNVGLLSTSASVSGGVATLDSDRGPAYAVLDRYLHSGEIAARARFTALPSVGSTSLELSMRAVNRLVAVGGQLNLSPTGDMTLTRRGGSASVNDPTVRVAGYVANTWFRFKVQVIAEANGATTVRIKVWLDADPEPAWQYSSFATMSVVPGQVLLRSESGSLAPSVELDWVEYVTFSVGETVDATVGPGTTAYDRSAADTVAIGADTSVRLLERVRGTTDTTSLTETATRTTTATRTASDSVAATDAPLRTVAATRSSTDTVVIGADVVEPMVRGPPQHLRPEADVSGNWRGEDLRATNIWTSVRDESDATYAESPLAPTSTDQHTFALPAGVDPETDVQHVVRYRYSASAGTDVVVELLQGTTVIASWTHTDPPSAPTLVEQPLTEAEAAQITDYGALRIRVRGV